MNRLANTPQADRLVRLALATSTWQATFWRQALELEGIPCQVIGDKLITRGTPAGRQVPELLVPANELEQALAVLQQTMRPGSVVTLGD